MDDPKVSPITPKSIEGKYNSILEEPLFFKSPLHRGTRVQDNPSVLNGSQLKNETLSFQSISALSNSQAITKALFSLQKKIREVKKERDMYKLKFEQEVEKRKELEKEFRMDKISLLKDKEMLLQDRSVLANRVDRLKEEVDVSVLKAEGLQKNVGDFENERHNRDELLEEMERVKFNLSKSVMKLNQDIDESEKRNLLQQKKIQELSSSLVAQNKKVEKLSTRNKMLNKTVDEMLNFSVHKNEASALLNNTEPIPFPTEEQPKKWKRRKPKKKRAKSAKRQGSNKTSEFVHERSKRSRLGSTSNISKRLKRANLYRSVPFISEASQSRSFNVNSVTQSGLNMGISQPTPRDSGEDSAGGTSKRKKRRKRSELNDIRLIKRLKCEYDALVNEVNDLTDRARFGDGTLNEGVVEKEIEVLEGMMRKKRNQIEFLQKYVNNQFRNSVYGERIVPRIKGAKKRAKTLRLFHKLKKTAYY